MRTEKMLQSIQTPECILVFSGKRKSGKDYLADCIMKNLGADICCVLRLSGPLKKQYAKEHNLDYAELLNASSYKEHYRAKMIKWGEDKRRENPSYFCDIVVKEADACKKVWVISDSRRKTDVKYFKDNYPDVSKFVRICASDDVRRERGFEFTPGVDDAESECGLDEGVEWDFIVENSEDNEVFKQAVDKIMTHVQNVLSKS